ncbi:MAG: D-alanine--D-alanine ligase, partial [Pacificimonas sp.]
MKVCVLMGGWSAEREVSLTSGKGIAEACRELGHETVELDMGRDVAARVTEIAPDIVFNALHGVPGEDGTVQGMLDLLEIPYTHSGMAASVISIDKELTKRALVPAGIRMPTGKIVKSDSLHISD